MIMAEVRRPRGRPRPDETIARDQVVLAYLRDNGPQTRNDLTDALGLEDDDRAKVYLSLRRLRDQELVCTCAPREGSDMLWMAVEDKPCP